MTLLCQTDSYKREITSQVMACKPHKKLFQVSLRDSLFYPEGGGQPADHGWIGSVPVIDVQKDQEGNIYHYTRQSVPLGNAQLRLDWRRRFDHMQQHSGQHLLTAIALRDFGWSTEGFHLGQDTSAIELSCAAISEQQKLTLQGKVNEALRTCLGVRAKVLTPEQYQQTAARSRRLPKGLVGDIRLIEIEGLDLNTCGGTHVQNTADLQICQLLHTEKIRGRMRLHFVFGQRVLHHFEEMFQRQQVLTQRLCQGPKDHLRIVEKWSQQIKQQQKSIQHLEQQLIAQLVDSMMADEQPVLYRANEQWSMVFLNRLANELLAKPIHKPLVLGGDGVFVVHATDLDTRQLKNPILQIISGRGGGKPPRIQGKAAQLQELPKVVDLLLGAQQDGLAKA